MLVILRMVGKLPFFNEIRLEWQRVLLDRYYAVVIAEARKSPDNAKVQELEQSYRFEIDMHAEEEDALITKKLLQSARRLRVLVPQRYNYDKNEKYQWYEGRFSGEWYLTAEGIAALRDEIRREQKARQESRSHLIVWISALTGIVGAISGLVALLIHKEV
jgi:hypothetical protein